MRVNAKEFYIHFEHIIRRYLWDYNYSQSLVEEQRDLRIRHLQRFPTFLRGGVSNPLLVLGPRGRHGHSTKSDDVKLCNLANFEADGTTTTETVEMCKHSTATACWVRLRQSGSQLSQVLSINRLYFDLIIRINE